MGLLRNADQVSAAFLVALSFFGPAARKARGDEASLRPAPAIGFEAQEIETAREALRWMVDRGFVFPNANGKVLLTHPSLLSTRPEGQDPIDLPSELTRRGILERRCSEVSSICSWSPAR